MAITLTELQEKLKLIDEISVMEILEITSEDLANRFIDRIESKYDQLITEFEDMEDQGYDEGNEWWETDSYLEDLTNNKEYNDEE